MNRLQIENNIFSIMIEYPDNLEVVRENLKKEDISDVHRRIFSVVMDLYENGESVNWITVAEILSDTEVSYSYIKSLLNMAKEVPSSSASDLLRDEIRKLKTHDLKMNALKLFEKGVRADSPNLDALQELLDKAKMKDVATENSSFDQALKEFRESKTTKEWTNIFLGLPTFDNATDNYQKGEILTIVSRSGVGKTFQTLNFLQNTLNITSYTVGLFSMEMPKAPIVERMIQVYFDVSRDRAQEVSETYKGRFDEFIEKNQNLRVYSKIYSVEEVQNIIKKEKLDIVIIDFLQLMKKPKGRSRYEQVTEIIEKIKEMAKNLDVFVILVAQLSRKAQGGWVPVTADMIRESGAIEENSDFIIGSWNPYLNPEEKDKDFWRGRIVMSLLKNKRGPTKWMKCHFSPYSRKIYEEEPK